MYSNGIQMYRKTNVVTADPKRLVLMCYEGAIDCLKMGKQKLTDNDYEGKEKNIAKARDIIYELKASLNFEKGENIAKNLDSLYNYMQRRITEGDLMQDLKALEEVIQMLEELKSAWETIFYEHKNVVGSEISVPGAEEDKEVASYSVA
jgi:flagellar protein FliS